MFTHNPTQTRDINRQYEAEQRQFAARQRIARVARPETSPLLANLGKRMVEWGNSLQDRYQDAADTIQEWRAEATAATQEVAYVRE